MADENNYQYYTPGQDNQQPYPPQGYNQFNGNMPPQEEKANVGLAIVCFLVPIVGLILFLVERDEKPKAAKTYGINALISFVLRIILIVIIYITVFVAGISLFNKMVEQIDAFDDYSFFDESQIDTSDNIVGDYECVVKESTIFKDIQDRDAILIVYEFTNHSDDTAKFDFVLDKNVYQDGVELDSTFPPDKDDFMSPEIKSGVTLEVKKAYVLRNTTSPVESEISEVLSFSDDKIVTTINLQ